MERHIVNIIPAAIAVTDSFGVTRFMNQKFRELVEFSCHDDMRESPLYRLLDPPWSLIIQQLINDSHSGATRNVMRINERWYRLAGQPWSPTGEQQDMSETTSDSGSNTLIVIEDYSVQSGHLSHINRDTIDDILFHIRSPLTAMRCSLSLLNGSGVLRTSRDQTQSILRILQDETDRLNILLNNLNALLLIDSNTLSVRSEPRALPAGSLIHYTIGALTRFAQLRDVTIRLTLGEDLPDVCGDEDYLVKAIRNILINAIMYSPLGSDVSVLVREEVDCIRISIIDRGDGINSDELDYIFQRFYRGSNARDKEIPGFGLGLYVARHLIECCNGTLTVRSQPLHGSQFDIELPLDDSVWLS